MTTYGEQQLIRALVPLLISRLPNPFHPTEEEAKLVANAAERWASKMIDLEGTTAYAGFLFDEE